MRFLDHIGRKQIRIICTLLNSLLLTFPTGCLHRNSLGDEAKIVEANSKPLSLDGPVESNKIALSKETLPPVAEKTPAKKELKNRAKAYPKATKSTDTSKVKEKAEVKLAEGRKKFDGRDFLGAEADYTAAIKLDPQSALAYHRRGYTRFELQKYRESISDLDKAISLKPDYIHAYNNRGRAKTRLNDYDGAERDYKKIIALDPDYILAYTNLTHIYIETNNNSGALATCKMGIDRYYNLKNKYVAPKEFSFSELKKSTPVDPQYAMLFNNCSRAQSNAGNFDAAIKNIDEALTISPNNRQFKEVREQLLQSTASHPTD